MDNLWNYLPNLKKKLYVILYYKDRNHTTSATLHVCKHDAYVEVNLPWCYHCYLVDKYWQMSLCRQRAHYDLCFVGGSLDLASKLSHPSQMHKNHAWNISIVSNSSDGFTNFMKLPIYNFLLKKMTPYLSALDFCLSSVWNIKFVSNWE